MPDGATGGGTLACKIGGGGITVEEEALPACDLRFGECCGTGGGGDCVVDLLVGVCWGTGGGGGAVCAFGGAGTPPM